MFRSLWIHKLLGLKSRSVRRRQASQTRRQVRLNLEGLEDRITPAVFNPTDALGMLDAFTFANSNPGTAVVINLNAADTYNLNDIGDQLLDKSTAGITINGNGATVTAATNNRLFEINNGDKLVLNDLTATGGNVTSSTTAAKGGAIADFGGYLTLSGVTVTNNSVHSDVGAYGGGIYVSASGTLSISNSSSIDHNQAIGTAFGFAGTAYGGGIYMGTGGGAVSISNSTLSSNLARGGVSSTGTAYNAYGGGVYLSGPHTITLTDAIVTGNHAVGGNAGGSSGNAGGSAYGGGMYLTGTGWNVTITGTTLSNNVALGGHGGTGSTDGTGGNGGYAYGGGAYIYGSGSGFSLLSSSVSDNSAQAGAGGKGGLQGGKGGAGGYASGGGVYFSYDAPLTVTSTSFDSNSALGGNGGTGGVGTAGGAGGTGGTGGTGGYAYGGGLYLYNEANTAITNGSFTNNQAVSGNGGAGGAGGVGTTGAGGTGGQGGYANSAYGGGIYSDYHPNGALTMINTTLGVNTAQGGNAGAGGVGGHGFTANGAHGSAGSNGGYAYGGGMYDTYAAILLNDTIAFNAALAGSGGLTPASGFGGGIYASPNAAYAPSLTNDILEGNQANTTGPDIYGNVNLTGSTHNFISNTSGLPAGTVAALSTDPSNILNDPVNQLAALTTDLATGLAYYPLLANSVVINAGDNAVLPAIANAQGFANPNDALDEIDHPRVSPMGGNIDMGAVEFSVEATTTTVSPVTINFSAVPTLVQLTAAIADGNTTVNEGVVTFTVTDSLGNPVGSTIANVPVSGGVATTLFTVPANTPAGFYTITASYTDPINGNAGGRFAPSIGANTLTVAPVAASTSVVATNAVVTFSTSAQTDNISVPVNSPAGTVNEGTVTVTLAGNTIGSGSVINGSAAVTLNIPAGLAASSYQLQESYSDGVNFAGSSALGTLTVSAASTTVTPGDANAIYSSGTQTTSVTVSVASPSGIVDSGTVNILLNGNTIGSGAVSAGSTTVTLNLPAGLAAGSYNLTENYSGTGNLLSSSAFGTLTVSMASTTVTPGNASVDFSSSAQTTSVLVGVTSPNGIVDSGTVSILLNGNTIGSGNVSNGSANVTITVPAGQAAASYTLTENYSGTLNLISSTANGSLTVSTASTTVTAGNATSTYSSSTQITNMIVGVNSPNGTVNAGTVTVKLNGNTIGTGNVSNGSANVTLTIPAGQAAGSYTLEEDYADIGGSFLSSTANGSLNVLGASTTVSPGSTTVDFNGSSQTVGVTVGVSSPSGTVNSGTVTVLLNGVAVGSAAVSNGSATVTLTIPAGQAVGSYTLTEKYSGDANHNSSTANGTLTVNEAPPPQPTTLEAALAIAIDTAALLLQGNPSALAQLATLSHVFLGIDLPSGQSALIAAIQANVNFADGLVASALQAGASYANTVSGTT